MSRSLAVALFAALAPGLALAAGFAETGDDLAAHEKGGVELEGYLRGRGDLFYDLDLDRGVTPSGQPLFPVPLGDPLGQTLTYADARLRTDLALYAPGGLVAVKLRTDVLDDVPLGGSPVLSPGAGTAPTPAASPGQQPLQGLRVKRAYAQVLTPVGLVMAGRMGAQWGLGLLANGGDCDECDFGDAADRVAFVTPLLGHLFALAYDLTAVGPLVPRAGGARLVDVEPSADVRSVTFAVMNWRDDFARARRRAAGKPTFEYGAYASYRWQENDVPASYLGAPVALGPAQVVYRGYRAAAFDGWLRYTGPALRVEAEEALLLASVDQASLVPGVLLTQPITATQHGGAVESEWGERASALHAGLDLGYASGDPAPGFGAYPSGTARPVPGDLDGPQAWPPYDDRIDNFRFSPDYQVDRILFRELVGTVTDAIYAKPHARWTIFDHPSARLEASLAVVASRAVYAQSTPGGAAPLGVELDPTLTYASKGLRVALEHAVLFPLAGLDNPALGLAARPAQLLRLRAMFLF